LHRPKDLDYKEQYLASPKNDRKEKHSKTSKTKKSKKEKSNKRSKKSNSKGISVPVDSQTVPAETQHDFDQKDFKTLFPSATTDDANGDSYNLEIIQGAREKAVELHDLYENGNWTSVKDQDGIQLYKCKNEGDWM
jgi:hypothetical protein